MDILWYEVIITLPAYAFPVAFELKRNSLSASTFFFLYNFLGTWLYSFLLASELISSTHLVAPWAISTDELPWMQFAGLNVLIFLFQLFKRKKKPGLSQISAGGTRRLAYTVLIFSLACLIIQISTHGSFHQWIAASYKRATIDNSLLNLTFIISTFNFVASIVLYSNMRRVALGKRLRLIIYGACLFQALYSLASGGRSVFLLYLISLSVAHGKTKIPRIAIYALLATFTVAVSGLIIYARYLNQEAKSSFDLSLANLVEASYTGFPFIDHFQLSRKYVEDHGHDYGHGLLNVALLPIPRALWTEKPIQLSRTFRETFWGDSTGGIPPGLFGEAYVGFGWLTVILVASIYGLILRLLSQRFSVKSGDPRSLAVSAVLGSAIGFVLIRGGLDIGAYRVGIIVFSLYLALKVSQSKKTN